MCHLLPQSIILLPTMLLRCYMTQHRQVCFALYQMAAKKEKALQLTSQSEHNNHVRAIYT